MRRDDAKSIPSLQQVRERIPFFNRLRWLANGLKSSVRFARRIESFQTIAQIFRVENNARYTLLVNLIINMKDSIQERSQVQPIEEKFPPKSFGTMYFIDFENVHSNGLQGAENLTTRDAVVLFFSDGAHSIDIESVIQLNKAQSTLDWNKSAVKDQQVDKALLTRLGYEVGKRNADKYVVVSRDGGYKPIINMLHTLSNADIALQPAIVPAAPKPNPQPAKSKSTASPPATTVKNETDVAPRLIREALRACNIEASKIEVAVAKYREYLKHAPTQKTAVNNALMTCLSISEVKTVYAEIKPQLK